MNPILQQMAAQGQSVFTASGDQGCASASSLADQPFITAVGGTTKGLGWVDGVVTNTYPGETCWAHCSGGYISGTWPIPSYQVAGASTNPHASQTMRNVPDIAAYASAISNPACFIYLGGKVSGSWQGTSIASPLWAAFAALANQYNGKLGLSRVGFLNPTLYAIGMSPEYASVIHNINDGNNNSNVGCRGFVCSSGYNLVTGWGSMNGATLFKELLSTLLKLLFKYNIS